MLGVGTWFVDQQALALDVLSKEVEVRLHCLRGNIVLSDE